MCYPCVSTPIQPWFNGRMVHADFHAEYSKCKRFCEIESLTEVPLSGAVHLAPELIEG